MKSVISSVSSVSSVSIIASVAIAALIVVGGPMACSKPREAKAVPAPPPIPASPPVVTPAPVVPAGNLHGFAPTEVVSVSFKEINEKGYPIVVLENLTDRNIETIRGGFRLHDSGGAVLHSTGLTIAVPGQVFIAAGARTESSPFGLNRKEDLMQRLTTNPGELSFSFVATDVTFVD